MTVILLDGFVFVCLWLFALFFTGIILMVDPLIVGVLVWHCTSYVPRGMLLNPKKSFTVT